MEETTGTGAYGFGSLWTSAGGSLNTGLGLLGEWTGTNDAKREQDLALAKLATETERLRIENRNKQILYYGKIIGITVVCIVILVLILKKKK